MKPFTVKVIEDDTGRTVHSIECETRRKAEQVERGININLNHELYSTEIVEQGEKE